MYASYNTLKKTFKVVRPVEKKIFTKIFFIILYIFPKIYFYIFT